MHKLPVEIWRYHILRHTQLEDALNFADASRECLTIVEPLLPSMYKERFIDDACIVPGNGWIEKAKTRLRCKIWAWGGNSHPKLPPILGGGLPRVAARPIVLPGCFKELCTGSPARFAAITAQNEVIDFGGENLRYLGQRDRSKRVIFLPRQGSYILWAVTENDELLCWFRYSEPPRSAFLLENRLRSVAYVANNLFVLNTDGILTVRTGPYREVIHVEDSVRNIVRQGPSRLVLVLDGGDLMYVDGNSATPKIWRQTSQLLPVEEKWDSVSFSPSGEHMLLCNRNGELYYGEFDTGNWQMTVCHKVALSGAAKDMAVIDFESLFSGPSGYICYILSEYGSVYVFGNVTVPDLPKFGLGERHQLAQVPGCEFKNGRVIIGTPILVLKGPVVKLRASVGHLAVLAPEKHELEPSAEPNVKRRRI